MWITFQEENTRYYQKMQEEKQESVDNRGENHFKKMNKQQSKIY